MPRDDRWDVFSPLFADDDKDDAGMAPRGRQSFSYSRLPEPLLKLSVLKLDGSSFDVKIGRTASVRELKLAVEGVFSRFPKEGGVQISWSHVWSYFCLCYGGHKLTDDRASLQSLGIHDGVQLRFVRQLTVNHSPTKRKPRNHGAVLRKHRRSLTDPEVLENFDEDGAEVVPIQYADEKLHNYEKYEDSVVEHKEFRLSHLLRQWLSYTRVWSSGSRRSGGMGRNFRRVIKDDTTMISKRKLL